MCGWAGMLNKDASFVCPVCASLIIPTGEVDADLSAIPETQYVGKQDRGAT